jgi:putative methionine-R-sulfoxide reductase with GAF domain
MLLESILANLNTTFTPQEFEELLIYFSGSVIKNRSEEELAWDLVENCISKLHFEDCVIYFVNENTNTLVQIAAYGPKNPKPLEILQPIEIPIGQGITGAVANSGIGEIVKDTSKDSRYIVDDSLRLSELAVPIKLEDQVIGVIDCEHSQVNYFNEGHLQILSAIAAISGIKIGQIRADRERREQQKQLLKAEEEMLQAKIMAIRAQMNPHFIFNALNSIQHFVTSDDKRVALKYISLFGKLVRFYLRHLESETIALGDEVNMLRSYMELQKLRYGKELEYEIQFADDLRKLKIPTYILHSLVENMIEFSVNASRTKTRLAILIERSEGVITMIIRYNFEDINQKIIKEPIETPSLQNWMQFVSSINKLKHLDIDFTIKSERSNVPDAHGGIVILKLPLQ